MELELKHLAPYLPYGLKGVIKNTTVTLKSLNQHSLETSPSVHGFTYCCFTDFKPSLRPLSDLTKEIEHNGEKFVPIEIIKERWGYKDFEYQGYSNYSHWFKLEGNNPAILHLPYCFIELFLEWHFDIYGLLKKGLAIEKQ